MTNKEKFLALVSKDENNTLDYIKSRIENRAQLRASRDIAYKVLDRLRELKWSQKELAEKLGVSPQQVNKIVKGSENLTLSTIVKLEEILTLTILEKKEGVLNPIEQILLPVKVIQSIDKHILLVSTLDLGIVCIDENNSNKLISTKISGGWRNQIGNKLMSV